MYIVIYRALEVGGVSSNAVAAWLKVAQVIPPVGMSSLIFPWWLGGYDCYELGRLLLYWKMLWITHFL